MSNVFTEARRMGIDKRKILVVEDDPSLSEILHYNLSLKDYLVQTASDGQTGLDMVAKEKPDLVLLDVMLPKMDGITVCREIRKNPATKDCIVMMLTAKSEEADQLVGFSVGADDYVVKPFSVHVLLKRIHAILRRLSPPAEKGAVIAAGELVIDRARHRVTNRGETVDLTPTEFRLLETMVAQPGIAFDRHNLLESAVGDEILVLERTIDVHIRALRKKLGKDGSLIETVRGVGYRFQEAEANCSGDGVAARH